MNWELYGLFALIEHSENCNRAGAAYWSDCLAAENTLVVESDA